MRKMKRSEMPAVRNELFKKQHGVCPITGRPLPTLHSHNLCIDHDHETGAVRAVLSKSVNGMEGKVKNVLTRWGQCQTPYDMIKVARGLADYWELHLTPQTDLIYHTHKTKEELRAARNKRARAAYAKKKKEIYDE